MNVSMGDLQDPIHGGTLVPYVWSYFVPEMAIKCSSVHPPQKIPFKSFDRSPSFFFFWAFRLTTTSLSDLEKKIVTLWKINEHHHS